ncbi:MAG: hypothetical protein KA163_00330 [Bacteroidia bacterium]|nr:hypothetical protein [Bacteroidia bacterium]
MKRILIILFLTTGVKIFSQDQLFKKDNSKLEVKVLEVTPDEVKYKLKNNANGPLYIVRKSDVALIIYENGTHETYPDAKPPTQTVYIQPMPYNTLDSLRARRVREREKQFLAVTKNKNIVFLNALGFLNAGISLSYFREFTGGLFDIHIPIAYASYPQGQNYASLSASFFGSGNFYGYKITQKSIDVGLGAYINTSGKKPVTHFVGPLIRFAQYNGTFEEYDQSYYYQSIKTHGFVVNDVYFMLNNGVLFRLSSRFNLMINGAIGFVTSRTYIGNNPINFQSGYYYDSYNSAPVLQFGFNFGYRF